MNEKIVLDHFYSLVSQESYEAFLGMKDIPGVRLHHIKLKDTTAIYLTDLSENSSENNYFEIFHPDFYKDTIVENVKVGFSFSAISLNRDFFPHPSQDVNEQRTFRQEYEDGSFYMWAYERKREVDFVRAIECEIEENDLKMLRSLLDHYEISDNVLGNTRLILNESASRSSRVLRVALRVAEVSQSELDFLSYFDVEEPTPLGVFDSPILFIEL